MNRSLKFKVPRGCRSDLKNSKNPTEYVSPNRFNCLNNYRQFENNVDFNKEIAHVISSNILTTSKGSTDISQSKERSKEPIRGRKIKTNRPNAPTTTIIGDSMIKKDFGNKLSRKLNYKHHVVVRSFGGTKTQCMQDYIRADREILPKTNNSLLRN